MCDNRLVRRIFRHKREKVTRSWRALHNEELHNIYSSPNTFTMIRARRMRWAGHAVGIRDERYSCNVLVQKRNLKENDQL
jgi:hypothetical protein